MVRVSVFSKNDIKRLIIKAGLIIIIFYMVLKIYDYSKIHLVEKQITTEQCIAYLTEEVSAMSASFPDKIFDVSSKEILEGELRMSVREEKKNTVSEEIDEVIVEENLEKEPVEEVSTSVKTEVVKSKYKDNYNFEIDGVKIKNESSYNLNEINLNCDIKVDNKNVIIFHTHTCESYTPTEKNNYESSGNFRSTDLNYSVAHVGDVLDQNLTTYGFKVKHDKTYHDYPSYTGSYGRSLTTVSNILAKSEKADIIIDLHRDAIGDDTYAPKVKIGDEYAAQIMFVIGTDGSGLEHPNWQHNLEFAIKVQKKANEMYPGLFKAILVRNARYNQHLGADATIMEFGATGNTLEECEVSAKYLAKVLDEVTK